MNSREMGEDYLKRATFLTFHGVIKIVLARMDSQRHPE